MAAEGMKTVGDLFSKTELQLVQALNLNKPEVLELLRFVAQKIAPPMKTASDLLRERRENGGSFFVCTGLPTIDNSLQVQLQQLCFEFAGFVCRGRLRIACVAYAFVAAQLRETRANELYVS